MQIKSNIPLKKKRVVVKYTSVLFKYLNQQKLSKPICIKTEIYHHPSNTQKLIFITYAFPQIPIKIHNQSKRIDNQNQWIKIIKDDRENEE